MSKLYYFTTAQDKEEFASSLLKWKVSPNLSNQNFHNKFIRALSLDHNVEVISVRPINSNYQDKEMPSLIKEEGNISWRYVKVKQGRLDKKLFLSSRILKIASPSSREDSVIVDTLNLSLLESAKKFARKNKLKLIGVCTDNPLNISFTSNYYKNKLLKLGQSLDGYICLTPKLNDLYNVKGKPSVLIDGITEESVIKEPKNKIEGDYLFFGGSLMREYGVRELMKAFESLERKDLKLVICGHHEEENFKEYVKNFENVIYLGALGYDEVNALESHALIAINPRPINEKIDDYSFPSKTLEYLSNGVLTISVRNTILEKNYQDCIIWAKSSDVEDLKEALQEALSLDKEEVNKIKKLSKQIVASRTSFSSINIKLSELF